MMKVFHKRCESTNYINKKPSDYLCQTVFYLQVKQTIAA